MGEQGALLERMPDRQAGQRLLNSVSRLGGLLDQCETLNTLGYLWLVLTQERGGSLTSLLQCAAALRQGIQYWLEFIEANSHVA
jgi:hypothetical protein